MRISYDDSTIMRKCHMINSYCDLVFHAVWNNWYCLFKNSPNVKKVFSSLISAMMNIIIDFVGLTESLAQYIHGIDK